MTKHILLYIVSIYLFANHLTANLKQNVIETPHEKKSRILKHYKPRHEYEDFIEENFLSKDRQKMPKQNGIVIIGSSSIRMWNSYKDDLAPLTTIKRGFGGSTYRDLLHYSDELILKYKPRAVLLYAGGNDIKRGKPLEEILDWYNGLIETILEDNKDIRIYTVSCKPSIKNMENGQWERIQKLNDLIKKTCDSHNSLTYINNARLLLNENGKSRPELHISDMNHLNPEGYKVWVPKIREILIKKELQYEKAN